jgi:hypothetical protein
MEYGNRPLFMEVGKLPNQVSSRPPRWHHRGFSMLTVNCASPIVSRHGGFNFIPERGGENAEMF